MENAPSVRFANGHLRREPAGANSDHTGDDALVQAIQNVCFLKVC